MMRGRSDSTEGRGEGPDDARVTGAFRARQWLADLRDVAVERLARRELSPADRPKRMRAKSVGWRRLQAMAKPLSAEERRDCETVVATADELLRGLDGTNARELLHKVMVLGQAYARVSGQRFWHMLAPEREDAPKRWREDERRAQMSRKAAELRHTRMPRRDVLEAKVREVLRRSPGFSFSKACEQAAGLFTRAGQKVSASHVRAVLKDSPLKAEAARRRRRGAS